MTKKRPARGNFRILLVSQYRDFLRYLEKGLVEEGISSECIFTAESAGQAKRRFEKVKPVAVVLGYMLPDANGVEVGVEFFKKSPKLTIVILTAAILPPEEESLCEEFNFPVLRKHDSSVADLLAVIRADAQSRFEGNYLAADRAGTP
jgi:CheY-like chemotaxis protein